jgi:electron transfer flavoprotein alpha subunit
MRESQAVLLSATALGRDLAPRLAARLRVGLASDCTDLTLKPDRSLQAVRPVYSGQAMATVEFSEVRPILVTLRPNVFPPAAPVPESKGEVVNESAEIDEAKIRARWVELKQDEGAELDVTEADIVVAGGRAMGNSENFQVIRDLAEVLGGAVGASRAAVDAEFIAHQHQVGQTGKVVSPKLYIACGISGAIQHLAGMSSSKVIVAINKDAEAPIFKAATYGLVGDLFKIVPMLTEAVRKLKSE